MLIHCRGPGSIKMFLQKTRCRGGIVKTMQFLQEQENYRT